MDKVELQAKVKKIIINILRNVDESKIVDKASFVDDFGADSLDQVEMIMAFEDEFEIEIPDDDVDKIRTVSEAIEYIFKKQGGRSK